MFVSEGFIDSVNIGSGWGLFQNGWNIIRTNGACSCLYNNGNARSVNKDHPNAQIVSEISE